MSNNSYLIKKIVFLMALCSFLIAFSIKQEISIGYDNNFMRFSGLELDSYHDEKNNENDYLGDSKYYDSAIISPSIQATFKPKIFGHFKKNIILKTKYNEYTSSNHKSYLSLLGRFELKLAPYSWIKFSYSIIPKYYLRTFIDRDIHPLTYYPCYFSNEYVYISYSKSIPIKKTWADIKLLLNNQFYNTHFTEYDTQIMGAELTLKSKYLKSYFLSLTYLSYVADNISYKDYDIINSTKIDRSYTKTGFKFIGKKTFKNSLISTFSVKFNFYNRTYNLDSWYYESDNWKKYYEYDLVLECSKKINRLASIQISAKHFFRDVVASQSEETLWIEDYKIYHRNELWLKFIYNFSNI